MNLTRVSAMASKEWRETIRDRMFLLLAFLLPVLWTLVFGYGLVLDVEHVPLAVIDRDHSLLSRDYVSRFTQSRYFDFRGFVESEKDLDMLLATTRVRAAIVVPERFQERLSSGEAVPVQTLLDGSFPLHADIAKGYVIAINQAFTEELLVARLSRERGLTRTRAEALVHPVAVEVRYLYNEEVRSTWTMVPALIMFALMLSSPLLTALGVVREKESGSIYNIYSSPVSRAEFLIGKLIPHVLISLANVAILWLMAVWLFRVPFKGDLGWFFLASFFFVLCSTGIGLLISLLVRTQMAALIITMIVAMVPTILFSGLLVPVSSLSYGARVQAHLFPAMYYTDVVRGSFLKGLDPRAMLLNVVPLAAFAVLLWLTGYGFVTKRPKV